MRRIISLVFLPCLCCAGVRDEAALEQQVGDAIPFCVSTYESATGSPLSEVDRARVVALEDVAEVWFLTGPWGRLHRLEVEPETPRVIAFCTVLVRPTISVVRISEPSGQLGSSKILYEKSTSLTKYADEKINDLYSTMELLFLRKGQSFVFDKKDTFARAEEIYQSNVDAWVERDKREMKSKAERLGDEALTVCESEYERLASRLLPDDAVRANLHVSNRSNTLVVVFAHEQPTCAYEMTDPSALVRCDILEDRTLTVQRVSDRQQVFLGEGRSESSYAPDFQHLCMEHRRQGSDFVRTSEVWVGPALR